MSHPALDKYRREEAETIAAIKAAGIAKGDVFQDNKATVRISGVDEPARWVVTSVRGPYIYMKPMWETPTVGTAKPVQHKLAWLEERFCKVSS